jgi:hypothetical protein
MLHLFSRVSGAEIVRALLARSIDTTCTITTAAKRGGGGRRTGAQEEGADRKQGKMDHSMNRELKWAYAIRQSTGQTRNRPIVALEKLELIFGRQFFKTSFILIFLSFTVFLNFY